MGESFNKDPVSAPTALSDGAENFLVVGIGASAGGVQALRDFFSHVPAYTRMAYVVILHLSPDHDSHLAEVLQSASALPVTRVERRVRVEPDQVYVIPPNKNLELKDGHIEVTDVTSSDVRRAPVDIFFRTLAQSHGQRAVSVVLSGTGANGSMGMKRVKEMGGLCIVQDPREAEYNDMPHHSLATGLVDYVLPVAQIPAQIIAYREQLKRIRIPEPPQETEKEELNALRDVFTQLRIRTGHDFSNYKPATVTRRIARRLGVHQLPDLTAYAHFMHEHPAEATALLKDLLISVTNFFRDAKAFEALERDIVPKLFEGKSVDDQVRVWVPGCATGEEAYSVTMLLSEYAATAPLRTADPGLRHGYRRGRHRHGTRGLLQSQRRGGCVARTAGAATSSTRAMAIACGARSGNGCFSPYITSSKIRRLRTSTLRRAGTSSSTLIAPPNGALWMCCTSP